MHLQKGDNCDCDNCDCDCVTVTVTYLAEKGFDLEMTMGNVYGDGDGDLGSSRCVGEMRCPSYCKYWKGTGECWLRYFGAASLLIQIQMVVV